jgi:hypothetical protein
MQYLSSRPTPGSPSQAQDRRYRQLPFTEVQILDCFKQEKLKNIKIVVCKQFQNFALSKFEKKSHSKNC